MNCVNSAFDSSEFTEPRRPRLRLAFTRAADAPATPPLSDAAEVSLPSASVLTAKAAGERELELAVVVAAIEHDLAHWRATSAEFKHVLARHLRDVARDPLTWQTALENVGPHPTVTIFLLVPESAAIESLHDVDVDVALIYLGGEVRAGEDVDRLTEAMTPEILVPAP